VPLITGIAIGLATLAAAALAVAARQPARLLSLALLEPAWAGNWDWSTEHRKLWAKYNELEQLPAEHFTPAFMRLSLRSEVELPAPPPGPPPPWMRQRPAGIRAFMRTFESYDLKPRHAGRVRPSCLLRVGRPE